MTPDEFQGNCLPRKGATKAELKNRTLTNLYNAGLTWLGNTHARLDWVVFAAYGWPEESATRRS